MYVHLPLLIITAEHTGKFPLKRDNSAVENAVGRRDQVPGDDRVLRIPPNNIRIIPRTFLPWDIGVDKGVHLLLHMIIDNNL
jgi:hypothetical protein